MNRKAHGLCHALFLCADPFLLIKIRKDLIGLHLKKQILRLYLLEFFGSFSLTDGVWIIFLIQRGFSLVQVGLAETVFHIASFFFEVPSGAVADLFGRKNAMIATTPTLSFLGEIWGVGTSFLFFGAFLFILSSVLLFLGKKPFQKKGK